RPLFARWSVVSAVMSSPLNITFPPVSTKPGLPMITFDSVDFPLPLGPINACVSPWRTIRSIPRRISLPSTVACRSSISSIAGAVPFVSLISHLDQDVVVLDLHVEHRHSRDGRERAGLAGLQVEGGAVLRALDRAELG